MSTLGTVTLTVASMCALLWAFRGQTAWWVPGFASNFIGGYINVGFKIYPHEVGMALSFAALGLMIVTNPRRRTNRPAADWSFFVVAAYMLGHLVVSCYLATAAGLHTNGTIARVYFQGLWAVLFGIAFIAYGHLRHLRAALILATAFSVLTILVGLLNPDLGPLSPEAIVQPDTLFVLPTSVSLKGAGLSLMSLLIVWFYGCQRVLERTLIVTAYVGAIYIVLLGSGRVPAATALLMPLLWATVQRKRAGVIVAVILAGLVVYTVNFSSSFYEALPDNARRSLSSLVVTRDVAERDETEGSNEWHLMLLESGRDRWTRDFSTFAFGSKVEGWDEDFYQLRVDDMADIAARLSAYENAFFTVTATLGVAGLLLFGRILYWLFQPYASAILRHRIRTQGDALAYVAVQSLVLYIGFCWIAGGYPSNQILFGVLAAGSFHDRQQQRWEVNRSLVGDGGPAFRPAAAPYGRR